jgi:4'-phosphopantetheinyl transferase
VTADGRPWVDVYELDLAGKPGPRDWACLDSGERERAARIVAPVRRDRFVARRAALRRILRGYGCDVFFSTADSGDAGAVAVASRRVGVDVEIETVRRGQDRVAARMFAADEQELLDALAGDERRRLFHRCWVAKEAYAKGTGRGLALPFDEFSVANVLRSCGGAAAVAPGWSVSVHTRGRRHLAVALEDRDV